LRTFDAKPAYLRGELAGDEAEATELLAVLEDREKHVTHMAEAPIHELPDQFTVLATREIKAGEPVGADAVTVMPPKSQSA
jgi:GMP synthase-like glutamine amidotransferase